MQSYIPQIPWQKFSEESIQSLLELFFKFDGYKTYNQHQIERAIEHGADIILKKANKKIAIAAKIKPTKKDAYQLIELSRRKENEKWYIYFDLPTPSFKKEMKNHKKIKFIDSKELNQLLYKSNANLYVSFLLDNTPIVYSSLQIQFNLVKIFKEYEKKLTIKEKPKDSSLDKQSLNILWRLKDDTSSLNKTFRSQQIIFENIETKEDNIEKNIEILHGYLSFLKEFNRYCKNVSYLINQFYKKKKTLFHIIIDRTRIRSNWLGIFCFTPFVPAFTKYISDEREKMVEQADNFFKKIEKYKSLSHLELPEEDFKEFNIPLILSTHSRIMANFFDNVECVIDDIFSYGLLNDEKASDWLVKKPSDKIPEFCNLRGNYFSDDYYDM